jgi:hypothetical protein
MRSLDEIVGEPFRQLSIGRDPHRLFAGHDFCLAQNRTQRELPRERKT